MFNKVKKFFVSFFAVDNSVNEQSVVGVYWGIITTVLLVLYVCKVGQVGLDLIITTSSAMLLSFGISGFKKVA